MTRLQGWARDGLKDEQIAFNMGVSRRTLSRWKKTIADIAQALCRGREVVDYEVENALLNSALSGHTTAQIFWLKNRKPTQWRDKPDEDNSVPLTDDPITKSLKELLAEDGDISKTD